ncbi:hypothetical protein MTO96_032984 [Rhipicephalus appendiculatus]
MSESQTSLTRRLRKKRPVCQPQGKGLSSRKAEDETCSESSSSFRERSECPPSRSIGRPSSSGTQSRPRTTTVPQSRRRSNERPPPLSGGAAARAATSRTLHPAPSTNGGREVGPSHEARSAAFWCSLAQQTRPPEAFLRSSRTPRLRRWSGDPLAPPQFNVRRLEPASPSPELRRETPDIPAVACRLHPEVLTPRLTIPSFFEQPPTPDVLEARRPADAAPSEAVRPAVEDPDVSNRQPDDREEGSTQFVLSMVGKMAVLLACWYLFLVSLDLLSSAFKLFAGHRSSIRGPKSDVIRNPVVGIMTGLLVTVLVQSSSSSTSITITLVGSQLLSVKQAIPIVMGANLGSSVTSSVAALSQVTRRDELRRAFAVATAHGLFNWLTLVVLLPFEVTFGQHCSS